jgi:hypothetical protein
MLLHKLEHNQTLLGFPVPLDFGWIEMVIPFLPALFSCPKIPFLRFLEKLFGNFTPFGFVVLVTDIGDKCTLRSI